MEMKRKYTDEAINRDIDLVLKSWKLQTKEGKKPLDRLKKKARQRGDNGLLGFVHYHFADLYYYRDHDYEKFKKNIAEAIRALMQSEEKELLARTYNFVGIDAVNFGSYDVAYNYYMTALRICEDLPNALVPGIVNSNLGQMFNEMGRYELARKHIREGLRIIKAHPEDGKYYRNLVNMHFQDGMISLAMNRIADVEKTMHVIGKLMEEYDDFSEGDLSLPLAFIKVRIALAKGQKKEAEKLLDDLIAAVENEETVYDCLDDLFTLLRYLTEKKYTKMADRIIQTIREKIENSDIAYVLLMFSEILVSNYEAAGNTRMVVRELKRQHELTKRLRSDQKELHGFSIDLIRAISDLQEKQNRILKENAILQEQAFTDALTGIPNRHSMNRELALSYERAFHEKKPLGVAFLDIDSFKEYNDTYGHKKGDECLKLIAGELSKLAEDPDIFCARYGGDEFIIVFENMDEESILQKARELADGIAAHKIKNKHTHVSDLVTISQGICYGVPREENKFWDYLETADRALYSAKRKGHRKEEDTGIRFSYT
ncbi:MAG: GGDEF domain-containing protein [Lachnospiraceae bacterium]|nr:GGDEF domain-containing protein [Lachnospiraceae bacterium]